MTRPTTSTPVPASRLQCSSVSRSHSRLALGTLALLSIAIACGRSGIPGETNSDDDDDGGTVRTLTVDVQGNGRPYSLVRSVPAGISCPGVCTADFPVNTAVALTASSATATFIDWTDACAGNAGPDCPLVLSSNLTAVARLATSGSVVWARRFGGTGDESGMHVAVGTDGSVVVSGLFEDVGSPTLGPGCPLAAAGNDDVFVARFSTIGACQWARVIGGGGDEIPHSLTASDAGQFSVLGQFDGGSISVDGNDTLMRTGTREGFAYLLDGSGAVVWGRRRGGGGDQGSMTSCFDDSGGLMYADSTDDNTNVNDDFEYGRRDLAMPDPPDIVGVTKVGGDGFDTDPRASACSPGNFTLLGDHNAQAMERTVFPTGAAIAGTGARDAWVARTTTSAGFVSHWTIRIDAAAQEVFGRSLIVGTDHRVVLAANVTGGVTVDATAIPDASPDNAPDVLVAWLASNGSVRTGMTYGTNGSQTIGAIAGADDVASSIFATGGFVSTFPLGGVRHTSAGAADLFVARIDSSGSVRWSRSVGAAGNDDGHGVSARGAHLYVTGDLVGSTAIETFTGVIVLPAAGGTDVLLMRLVP